MNPELPAQLMRQGMLELAWVGGPLFSALLGVGMGMGVLQAATQVNDPSVSALPKLVAGGTVVAFFGEWMMEHLAQFLRFAILQLGMR